VPNDVAIRPLTVTPSSGPALDVQRSDFGIHLEITKGLDELATVRGTDVIVPGLTGRIVRNRVKDVRTIELSGHVQGVGATDALRLASYRGFVVAIGACFDPTLTVTIGVVCEDGVTRSLAARPHVLTWGPEGIPGLRTLNVALESTDPDWTTALSLPLLQQLGTVFTPTISGA